MPSAAPRSFLRRLAIVATSILAVAAMPGCRDSGVVIAYRPTQGARYSYRITVHSTSVRNLEQQPERRSEDTVVLRSDHVVLASDASGSRVRVTVRSDDDGGGSTRTFVVRLDRDAQLVQVQEVEGLPASVLGELGLTEIFPTAAGRVPDRSLEPGARWTIDDPIELPRQRRVRARGGGRLVELGTRRGRDVATVRTVLAFPVHHASDTREGRVRLSGRQVTNAVTVRQLRDGAVEQSRATTRSRYRLALLRASGAGDAVSGTLTVEVRSDTERVR